jgi:hypothetical protein
MTLKLATNRTLTLHRMQKLYHLSIADNFPWSSWQHNWKEKIQISFNFINQFEQKFKLLLYFILMCKNSRRIK